MYESQVLETPIDRGLRILTTQTQPSPQEMGTCTAPTQMRIQPSNQQEIPVSKQAILIQCVEDHPGNPGWWRYSRPVLRHVTEVPNSSTIRWWYVQRPHLERRLAQQEWDLKYS